jgi:hypothetical protein
MFPLMFFGIVGGLGCAVIAYPHGLVAAFFAYMFGGALCALIPETLSLLTRRTAAYADEDPIKRTKVVKVRGQPENAA